MAAGLTPSQELIEIRLDNDLRSSLQEAIMNVLSTKPEHRIVSLATVAMGEFPLYFRALVVIEYVSAARD